MIIVKQKHSVAQTPPFFWLFEFKDILVSNLSVSFFFYTILVQVFNIGKS